MIGRPPRSASGGTRRMQRDGVVVGMAALVGVGEHRRRRSAQRTAAQPVPRSPGSRRDASWSGDAQRLDAPARAARSASAALKFAPPRRGIGFAASSNPARARRPGRARRAVGHVTSSRRRQQVQRCARADRLVIRVRHDDRHRPSIGAPLRQRGAASPLIRAPRMQPARSASRPARRIAADHRGAELGELLGMPAAARCGAASCPGAPA